MSFFGAYSEAEEEGHVRGRRTLAITFGHSKDHRPDLKQLLYILTVTEDGGVPIYFTSANGNTTDDTTHRRTWDLLHELVGRPDFLYVADCKSATSENMNYIARQQGRPNKNTKYVKKVKKRFDISWSVDSVRWAEAESLDGIFPLITNVKEMTAEEILRAYKRQPRSPKVNYISNATETTPEIIALY